MKKATFYEAKKRVAEAIEDAMKNVMESVKCEEKYLKDRLCYDDNGTVIKDAYEFERWQEAIDLCDEVKKQFEALIKNF